MPRDLTPEEIAAQYGNAYVADAPRAGDLTRLGTTWGDRVPAGLLGIGEAMGLPLQDRRLENQFENQETMRRFYQTNPNEPQSFRDINSVGDLGRYAKGLLIDSSPELVTGLVTGGVAGGVYGLSGLGRTVAGAAANAPSALGDILQNQREAGGRTDLASAALLTVPYAAADMVGLEGAVARGSMMRTGLKRLDDMQGLRGAGARLGANVAINAPIEGASETFQEMINQAARVGVNPQERMFGPDALERYQESFVGGAVLGGGVSGALGGWRRSEGYQAPQAPQQETNLLTPDQPAAPEPRQYGLVTQPAPLQQRINEQLGIGAKRVAGKKYAAQFEAAFNEPTGQYVQDPETGIERPLTVGEMLQRDAAPMDLTVANPAQTAAAANVVSTVAKSRDPQDIMLRDTLNVIPNQHSRALLTAMVESGIDPQSKVAEPVWNFAGQKYMTPARLTKALAILDESIIEARKGTTNVSSAPAPLSTAPTGLAAGSPLVQGGLGIAGPSNVGNVQPSTSPTITGTPAGQTAPTPAASGQPTTVVKTQRQLPTTRGAAGTTPLVDTSDDALEIARATGNAAEIEAMREDEAGLRADSTSLTDEDTAKIVATRFAKSKNAKRDAEILNAYLTALRTNAGTDKAAIQNAIGDRYGITAVAVRKIGNPSKLVEAGAELGFSAEQVLDLFQVDDNTKAQYTEIGKLEAEIKDLRKAYDKATDAAKRAEVADRMAALSERITKIKEKAADEKAAAFSAGLQEAGVSAAEGESAGFGFDTEREWARVEGESKLASQVLELSNQIDSLRASAEQLAAQGQTEAAQAARDAIAARQAKIDAVLAEVQGETKPTTKREIGADLAAAKAKFKEAKYDPKQMGVEELKLLREEAKRFNNKAMIEKIDASLSARMTETEFNAVKGTPNAVQVQSPTGVSVQPKTEAGQGVGQKVRRAEKPTSKGEVAILTPQEQYEKVTAGFPVPAWTDLTDAQQGSLTDLARRDQLNLAAVNRFVTAQPQQRTQARLTDESNIIDVEARVIDETVKPQVAKLAAPQVDRLEKHYGLGRDTAEFLAKVKEDIVLYATKGAQAVNAAIRDIIRGLHAGVLSVAMIFNPTGVSQLESFIVIPQETQVTTQVVQAQVPAEVKGMSDAGKQAYATLIPALQAKNYSKFITIADKPAGQVYVFKADGSLVMQKKALFGLAKGDLYKGNNDLPSNRVTPAGLFGIKVIDAAKGGSAAKTAGEYDFGKVFALEDPDAVVTFMHSVWLKESDAAKRAAALKNESAADSRYSFGCINLDKDMFRQMVSDYANEMDGSKLFVVPDVQSTVGDFLSGNVANDKLVREGVQPVTKTTTAPVRSATQTAGVDRAVTGKEEKMMFGKDKAKPVKKPYNAKELLADIKDFVRSDIPGRKLIIVDSVADLLSSKDPNVVAVGAALQLEGAYGVAVDGRAFLIADRISKGTGRAAFMHEVGAHLGLENLLPKALYDKLTAQVKKWAASDADTDEVTLAARAELRLMNANTTAEDMDAERLAYFIEEAVLAGIDPTASGKESGPLAAWFRTLWAAFKVAIRKLGFKPESLTAQDVVDMAFGAARLEMSGTFHGTAAAFRKFSHKFMNTGEGAQAFGWGSYVAEAPGVAKGYWSADVDRKTKPSDEVNRVMYSYGGLTQFQTQQTYYTDGGTPIKFRLGAESKTRPNGVYLAVVEDTGGRTPGFTSYKAADVILKQDGSRVFSDTQISQMQQYLERAGARTPEGSLMRVDIGVEARDILDWDKELAHNDNHALKARIEQNMSPELLEALEEEVGESLMFMTGEQFYRGLEFLEKKEGRVSEEFKDVEDYNSRLANAKAKRIVSAYLDEIIGIPALKFLDQNSRGDATFAEAKLKQKQELLKEKERTLAEDTKRADFWEKERDNAPPEYKQQANQTWLGAVSNRTSSEYQVELLRQEIAQDEKRLLKLQNPTRNIVVFNDQNIFRVGSAVAANRQRMRFGKNAPDQGTIAKNVAKLPKAAQQPVRNMLGAIGDVSGKGLDYLVFTSDLVNRAVAAGIPSAKKFVDLIGKSKAEARENEIAVEKIADMYALVPEKDRGTGENSVNRFLFDSTREAKWGYGQFRDPAMGDRFDALSKEAQDFVKAVFEHGSNVLAQKKKVVLDSTNSEYDAMIAIARANGDKAAESKLINEKKATIKRFQTLFKIRDGMPYAPIKRNGSHVVIAKSKEFLDAEAAGDAKKITELESNSDHYHVTFTDGKWEGRTLQQQLIDQGAFADVQLAERDTVVDEMFSGHSALRELTKMRSRVDEQARDGDKSAAKMLSLISQMYLEALAEGSARKSEMRRRGVEGEVDMIRSFAQQGRADANFMASVKYNPQVQDALQEMRTQSKTGDRARKSELFNELAKRYVQSMEYSPRPWLNKLTRMSSIYYLATSPAYYLQNLTQPWMMSVPAMAGQHDYTAASGALFKAYTELGDVMKSAKLLKQQFDFDKVPADVRDAIKELVNRGKIDIGLDTEIGEFKVEGDGYFAGKISAADKALRLAVQKVESINRLSTAMAAYRLELARTNGNTQAATDYADRILTETHGDYTSFNAPRIFNTGFGKVALQFRKFQLIQLAFYAKLIKDALQGNDRKAALKTLAFSLAHTGTLAGLMGMPGYAAISWAIGALLGDDDEPFDVTAEIRKAIGDEAVANLVLKGAPTLAGMDISGKVGAGNMLSIMPFSQADLSTTAGRAEAFGTLIGGASLGMASRMVDGLGLMLGGDWYRGIEQTMPKGVSDAMKAWRIANEGMTRRNGDIVVPANEISTMEAIMMGLGVTPVQMSTTYERQNVVKELTTNFQDRTTEIKNQYTKADRKGDTEAKAEARAAWTKLQDARVRNGLARKPLSDLLKAPAEQRKREKETVGGVQYTKATKKLAQQYAEE